MIINVVLRRKLFIMIIVLSIFPVTYYGFQAKASGKNLRKINTIILFLFPMKRVVLDNV
ncbi:MAG: hypothetical protein N2645_05095 [Clostridia bacterium]|nr:hypothetical protein [Clostridia bacterium]